MSQLPGGPNLDRGDRKVEGREGRRQERRENKREGKERELGMESRKERWERLTS